MKVKKAFLITQVALFFILVNVNLARASGYLSCEIRAKVTEILSIQSSPTAQDSTKTLVSIKVDILNSLFKGGHSAGNCPDLEKGKEIDLSFPNDKLSRLKPNIQLILQYSAFNSMTPDGAVGGSSWNFLQVIDSLTSQTPDGRRFEDDVTLGFDSEEDGVPDNKDNCPRIKNPLQEDIDNDGPGDLCDNCPTNYNPKQWTDRDKTIGVACDEDYKKKVFEGNLNHLKSLDAFVIKRQFMNFEEGHQPQVIPSLYKYVVSDKNKIKLSDLVTQPSGQLNGIDGCIFYYSKSDWKDGFGGFGWPSVYFKGIKDNKECGAGGLEALYGLDIEIEWQRITIKELLTNGLPGGKLETIKP